MGSTLRSRNILLMTVCLFQVCMVTCQLSSVWNTSAPSWLRWNRKTATGIMNFEIFFLCWSPVAHARVDSKMILFPQQSPVQRIQPSGRGLWRKLEDTASLALSRRAFGKKKQIQGWIKYIYGDSWPLPSFDFYILPNTWEVMFGRDMRQVLPIRISFSLNVHSLESPNWWRPPFLFPLNI